MTGAVARRRIRAASRSAGVGPGRRVDDEQDDVGLGDREPGLLLDARLDRVVRVELEPAGVDDDEPPAVPLGVAVQPVAGRPGAVLDDRRALAEEPVEQRALADVRSADDGDDRDPASSARHGQAAPAAPTWSGPRGAVGSEVVRPAGVAARSSAAWASVGGLGARLGRAGHLEDALGDVAQVLDRGRGAAGDADDAARPRRRAGSVRSWTLSIWIAGVPAISHSRVSSLVLALERPPTTTIRSTSPAASRVSCWRRIVTGQTVLTILSSWARETMNAASFSNFQGGWVDWRDERHPLAARDGRLPLLLLVDDDRVGREAEQADDLGVLRACRAGRSCSPPRRA